MRLLLAGLCLLSFPAASFAQEAIPWPKSDDPRVALEADGTIVVQGDPKPTQTRLMVIEKPAIPGHQYRLIGKIKYVGVEGVGYVEMLNRIPGQGEFFTRTLGEGGAMGKLTGTSEWREIELPFFSDPDKLPDRLTVNLILPGGGKVWLAPLTLTQASRMNSMFGFSSWGGWLGAGLGCVGGLVGTLSGFARTRRVGFIPCCVLAPFCVALLGAGIVMWTTGASFNVWYALSMSGLVGSMIFGIGIFVVRNRIARDEMRTMRAMDAM